MTKRSIESRLDDPEQETGSNGGVTVVYRDGDDLRTSDGERIDKDDHMGVLIVISRTLVMPREQAEREGREILGPAKNVTEVVVEVSIDIKY